MDIYQRVGRNRLRLAGAFVVAGALVMGISGLGLYLFHRAAQIKVNFWMLLIVFWLSFAVYAILRYAIGGRRVFKNLLTLPPWQTDNELRDALGSAKLASGMAERILLMEIPDPDINTFSLSLPNGSFMLFATQGIAAKLPERERVAILAHEIAHMQMGDTLIHTVMVKLAGARGLKKMALGTEGSNSPFIVAGIAAVISGLAFVGLYFGALASSPAPALPDASEYAWLAVGFLFLAFAALLPLIMNMLLRRSLDREREYYADMQAVYLTRDPEAVYLALKDAAEDVRDVLLLPACFDALLFHPVVSYFTYRPFRSQPAMADRIQRIRDAFPQLNVEPRK
jgi:Zn-dependent protease with chaperone function